MTQPLSPLPPRPQPTSGAEEVSWFQRRPTGGTQYTRVHYFRRMPNGGGTVCTRPEESHE
jgi:hypothetical protein